MAERAKRTIKAPNKYVEGTAIAYMCRGCAQTWLFCIITPLTEQGARGHLYSPSSSSPLMSFSADGSDCRPDTAFTIWLFGIIVLALASSTKTKIPTRSDAQQ